MKFVLMYADNFRDATLKAINLGDDADTTGAVYGQIAGTIFDIPPNLWGNGGCNETVIKSD